jgi:amino acid transporter
VVVAIFSLVGFECATAFGEEAKDPLKNIPRAVVVSLLVTGAFFVFISYVEIMALRNANPPLDKLTTPLSTLATMLHVDILQIPIDAGAMISFFSLALSCMNAGARVVYQMGRQGFFHELAGRAHASHETPHIAVTVMAIIEFAIPTLMVTAAGLGVSDAFGDAGTFGAFGFLGAYVFVSVAAPMYLKKIGQLRARDTAYAALALICLLVPAVGSVYPVPAPPVNLFPYIFAAYFLAGLVFFAARRKSAKAPTLAPGEREEALAS